MQNLVEQERKHRRYYEWAKMTFIVIGTATSMLVLAMLLGGMANLQAVTEATNNNSQLLIDCTTPEGKCYQDGNKRTGEAIGSINRVSIYAAYCSKIPKNQTVEQIEACIRQELEKEKK